MNNAQTATPRKRTRETDVKRLTAHIERLTLECAALREENERLRTEAERRGDVGEWADWGPLLEAENERLREALHRAESLLAAQYEAGARRGTASDRRTAAPCDARLRPSGNVVCTPCGGTCCTGPCDEHCPSFELCSKRVLIVGGVERMEALYRGFIEERGGELDYHAGHTKGLRELKQSLKRADIILCPVNCNSHGACIQVKNLAKKHNKPFYMLPNGSLHTISRLLGGETLSPAAGEQPLRTERCAVHR